MTGLKPNWDNHNAKTCPIINYFADRQNTEIILRKQEKIIEETCCYCKKCENCIKLKTYRDKFKQKGFWTFNKHGRAWDVYDRDWSIRNRVFLLEPLIKK